MARGSGAAGFLAAAGAHCTRACAARTPLPCPAVLPAPQVLDAVPWVAPRPLYLLATEQRQQPAAAAAAVAARYGADAASPGATYTLRTRVARGAVADELSMVLNKRAADGSALIRCSEMRDGVVAFEDAADAERYGQLLEAEGAPEVRAAPPAWVMRAAALRRAVKMGGWARRSVMQPAAATAARLLPRAHLAAP